MQFCHQGESNHRGPALPSCSVGSRGLLLGFPQALADEQCRFGLDACIGALSDAGEQQSGESRHCSASSLLGWFAYFLAAMEVEPEHAKSLLKSWGHAKLGEGPRAETSVFSDAIGYYVFASTMEDVRQDLSTSSGSWSTGRKSTETSRREFGCGQTVLPQCRASQVAEWCANPGMPILSMDLSSSVLVTGEGNGCVRFLPMSSDMDSIASGKTSVKSAGPSGVELVYGSAGWAASSRKVRLECNVARVNVARNSTTAFAGMSSGDVSCLDSESGQQITTLFGHDGAVVAMQV